MNLIFLSLLGISLGGSGQLANSKAACVLCVETTGKKVCSNQTTDDFPTATHCCDLLDTTTAGCNGVCIPYTASSLIGLSLCASTATDIGERKTTTSSNSPFGRGLAVDETGVFSVFGDSWSKYTARRQLAKSTGDVSGTLTFTITKGDSADMSASIILYSPKNSSFTMRQATFEQGTSFDAPYVGNEGMVFALVVKAKTANLSFEVSVGQSKSNVMMIVFIVFIVLLIIFCLVVVIGIVFLVWLVKRLNRQRSEKLEQEWLIAQAANRETFSTQIPSLKDPFSRYDGAFPPDQSPDKVQAPENPGDDDISAGI